MSIDISIPLSLGSVVLTWVFTLAWISYLTWVYAILLVVPTWIPIIGFGLASGAILGAVYVDHVQYKRKIKNDRIKIYGRLKGEKYRLLDSLHFVASLTINIANNNGFRLRSSISEFGDDPAVYERLKKINREDFKLRRMRDEYVNDVSKLKERWAKDISFTEILFDNLDLRDNISSIDGAIKAIENFMDTLFGESESELYEIKFIPSRTHPGFSKYEPVWQESKYADLKALDKTLENAIDDLLNLIRPFT
jgi:hypothetical protein